MPGRVLGDVLHAGTCPRVSAYAPPTRPALLPRLRANPPAHADHVRACVRACVRVWVRARVRVWVGGRARARARDNLEVR